MEKRWTESETGTDSRETETTQRDAQTNACLIFFSASSHLDHGTLLSCESDALTTSLVALLSSFYVCVCVCVCVCTHSALSISHLLSVRCL